MTENLTEIPSCLSFLDHKYHIIAPLGEGTFSTVYKAVSRKDNTIVALKVVNKTTAPSRVLEELTVLRDLNGENYCIKLIDVIRHEDQIVMGFPLIESIDFKDFLVKSTIDDMRNYMNCLIKAVSHLHSKGIIHRDIKPGNFLYNMEQEQGFLIDFGLAQYEKVRVIPPQAQPNPLIFFNSIVIQSKPPGFYEKDSRPIMKAPRAGTRGFRAPEVLFRSLKQTKTIDMWSVGVIMLSILTGQYPFFLSLDDTDALVEIALIFGNAEMRKAAKFYGRTWKTNISTIGETGIELDDLISKLNPNLMYNYDVIDLLTRLLDLNCEERITAEEALEHPFFFIETN